MKIGELAKTAGLTTKTVRFYEAEGLLPDAARTSSGYRMYGDADVQRLEFIRKAKRLGLSLVEIRSILQLHDRSQPTCVHVRTLLDAKLAQVDKVIADLQQFRSEIVRLREESGTLEDCRPSGGLICGIIEQGSITVGREAPGWVESKGTHGWIHNENSPGGQV